MNIKHILLGMAGIVGVGVSADPADAFFRWYDRGCNRYSTHICCRPYNAFSPVCSGNIICDGCCPVQSCGMNYCQPPGCTPHWGSPYCGPYDGYHGGGPYAGHPGSTYGSPYAAAQWSPQYGTPTFHGFQAGMVPTPNSVAYGQPTPPMHYAPPAAPTMLPMTPVPQQGPSMPYPPNAVPPGPSAHGPVYYPQMPVPVQPVNFHPGYYPRPPMMPGYGR